MGLGKLFSSISAKINAPPKNALLQHMDHLNLVPIFLFGLVGSKGSFSILNLFLGIVVDKHSCHELASSVFSITDRDIEP